MKSRSGFTLVELLIVVIIIATLATVTLVAYTAQQHQANDTTRENNVTIISEALERYYAKNNEYPSVRDIVNNYAGNTGDAVSVKLGVDKAVLVTPNLSGTNALSSTTAASSNDFITYTGPSTTSCQSTVGGGCSEYTLRYVDDSGATPSKSPVYSRHRN